MKKIILILFLMIVFCISVQAKSIKTLFEGAIKDSNIPKSAIAISLINLNSEKVVYHINDSILMHPASVLKMLTIVPIVKELGEDYDLTTQIYSRGSDGYVIKLGADPYFSSDNLKTLVSVIDKQTVKKIYIDDSIIEKKDWGEGWQWDDDLNVSMPRFNAYNLDGNIIRFTIMPTEYGEKATIINSSKYPIAFLNDVITADTNSVSIARDNAVAMNALNLKGTVNTPVKTAVPNNNLKGYFEVKLTKALEDRNIYLKEPYRLTTVNDKDILVAEIKHPISEAVKDILLNSNNMAIESIAKIAGGKKNNKTGTDTDGINLFNDYYKNIGLDEYGIRTVDSSGVSKNNILNADFITKYLVINKDNPIYKNLATPGEGTLGGRVLPLKDNLRAKTGTLSDISSIAGFITTKKGEKYAFCIMINDPKSSNTEKKILEDYLLKEIYFKL